MVNKKKSKKTSKKNTEKKTINNENYLLVNPMIRGRLDVTFQAENSLEAAKMAYDILGPNFNNNLPKFMFTLRDSRGVFKNFEVTESKTGNEIDYSIIKFPFKLKGEKLKQFKYAIKDFVEEMNGGGKKWVYVDDSSDDDVLYYKKPKVTNFIPMVNPIPHMYHWRYFPKIYDVPNLFFPTFVKTLYPPPYLEVVLEWGY